MRLADPAIMLEKLVLGRRRVEGRDDHDAVGAESLGLARVADHVLGALGPGADQDGHAAGRRPDHGARHLVPLLVAQ